MFLLHMYQYITVIKPLIAMLICVCVSVCVCVCVSVCVSVNKISRKLFNQSTSFLVGAFPLTQG